MATFLISKTPEYVARRLTSAISGGARSARRLLIVTFLSRLQFLQAA